MPTCLRVWVISTTRRVTVAPDRAGPTGSISPLAGPKATPKRPKATSFTVPVSDRRWPEIVAEVPSKAVERKMATGVDPEMPASSGSRGVAVRSRHVHWVSLSSESNAVVTVPEPMPSSPVRAETGEATEPSVSALGNPIARSTLATGVPSKNEAWTVAVTGWPTTTARLLGTTSRV